MELKRIRIIIIQNNQFLRFVTFYNPERFLTHLDKMQLCNNHPCNKQSKNHYLAENHKTSVHTPRSIDIQTT